MKKLDFWKNRYWTRHPHNNCLPKAWSKKHSTIFKTFEKPKTHPTKTPRNLLNVRLCRSGCSTLFGIIIFKKSFGSTRKDSSDISDDWEEKVDSKLENLDENMTGCLKTEGLMKKSINELFYKMDELEERVKELKPNSWA